MKTLLLILMMTISLGALAAPAEDFFKDKTKIENPFNLRDPFKAPLGKNEAKRSNRGFMSNGKGQYSNIGQVPFEQLSVDQLKVVGVLIGKERRALINVEAEGKSKIIILKEGMKIGPDAAELKAILPGGIVLVEKIVNVYGEAEYLETVIPISK